MAAGSRLSELLDQQQEPFSLDLFLLERGCSPAFLDATGGGGACSTCWPWPGTGRAAGKKKVRPAARMKVSCGSGVLRLLLCKLLRGKIAPAPTARKQQLRLPAVGVDDGEKRRTPGDSENSVPPQHAAEARTEKAQEGVEDNDSKKPLSPVFVLEQGSLEQPPSAHEQKALLIFKKFLQAAYSPSLLDLITDPKYSTRSNNSKTSPVAAVRNNHAHLEEEEDVFEEALAKATGVIASELAGGSRAAWPGDVQPERRDVGADIAAAVLDALVEETVTGMVGRDFAVDTARHHCWVSGG